MMEKAKIVERLGERSILLPALFTTALAANDRLKLRLTTLQQASARALDGGLGTDLSSRQAAELGDPQFERLVAGARSLDRAAFVAPGMTALASGIAGDLAAMLAPLEAAEAETAPALRARADAVLRGLPAFEDDRAAHADVSAMAAAQRSGGDSLHLLVMDLHKEINRLAARTATETIDGASVNGLDDAGRARVRAFMSGLRHTADLAFGHPGLGTTAAQTGARIVIQNDIGTTDAHVLVLHVEGCHARWTYTDVHQLRAKFFMSMFAREKVEWDALAQQLDADLAKGEAFYLVNGGYRAKDVDDLDRFLAFFGSRIVFLIDWNKARKALQTFVSKPKAVRLLEDAALRDKGHRAFLELGGVNLVYEAIRRAAAGHVPYGAPLADALGAEETEAFLRSVMTIASDGLRDGRSARLIHDEVQSDLAARLDSAEREGLSLLLRHLGLTRTLAVMIERATAPTEHLEGERRTRLASRAKQIEAKADRLTVEARRTLERISDPDALRTLIDEVENATDTFDEAAFLLSLASDATSKSPQLS